MRVFLIACSVGLAAPALLAELPDLRAVLTFNAALILGINLTSISRTCGQRVRLIVVGLALGVSWHLNWAQSQLDKRLPESLEGELLVLEAEVVGLPRQLERGQSITFRLSTNEHLSPGTRLRLNHYGELHFRPGQRWRVKVKLKQLHGYRNPGGPDRESRALRQGVVATGYIPEWRGNTLLGASKLSLSNMRYKASTSLTHALDGSVATGFLKALTIGDGSEISQQQQNVITRLGLNHLFVISGLHVGLITLLVFNAVLMLGRLGIRSDRISTPACAAVMAIIAAAGYSALAGWSISTQRAFIMAAALLLPYMLRRRFSTSLRFLGALVLVLVLDPLATTDRGFWLSFIAVGVLIFFTASYKPNTVEGKASLALHWLPQWQVFLGLLAPLLLLTHSASLIAPVINLLAIPIIGFLITPLALTGMLAAMTSATLGEWLLGSAAALLSLLFNFLIWLDGTLGSLLQWMPVVSHIYVFAFLAVAIFILLLPRQLKLRYLLMPLMLPLFTTAHWPDQAPNLRLDVLDVGQGLAVLLRTPGHSVLYDTGPAYSAEYDLGQSVVIPTLRALGVNRLDRIIVSHFDSDHSGGLESLMAAFPSADVIAGSGGGNTHKPCKAGQHWRWESVYFTFLHGPQDENSSSTLNDGSCVLLVNSGKHSVLLPGDIGSGVERDLAQRYQSLLKANVLIASHHGSNSSSGYPFLKMSEPDIGIFSAGYGNGFGHPHPEVVQRFEDLDIQALATFDTGMISFELAGSGIVQAPESYRCKHRHYWSWSGNRVLCRYL